MQSINLQITPNGVMPVINASQYDVGRQINFLLFDGSSSYIPSVGTMIMINGIKPNGDAFSYSVPYEDNVATVTLTEQMTVIDGEVKCELRLTNGGNDIGTVNFILLVEKAPFDASIPISDTEIPAIIELARLEQYNSEAWAKGTRNGIPVLPDDPTYENNAKYWAEHVQPSVETLTDVYLKDLANGQILKYNSTTEQWENADESGGGASALSQLTDVKIVLPSNGQILKYNSVTGKWENGTGGGGGILPHLVILSDAGSTVTVTYPDGVTTVTATQTPGSTTQWECDVTEFGTYTIDAVINGDDAQISVAVDTVKIYTIHDEHYFSTLSVYAPVGSQLLVTGGGETYTGTGAGLSAATFTLHKASTEYTIRATVDGVNKTTTVTTSATSGQSVSATIQYGTINLTFDDEFRSSTITCTDGITTITKTAPSSGNTMTFYPPNTGNWSISGAAGGVTYTASPDPIVVSSLSTAVSANLQTFATINVTLYGAKEDTISFTDAAGVAHTEVFPSGATSKSVSIQIDPNGSTITFTSSVAKNPSNLSQNYSKNISLTTSSTSVYVMPSNIIYWYGYYTGDIVCSTATGWSRTWIDPVFNTNYARVGGTQGKGGGLFGQFNTAGTIKLIAKGVTKPSIYYGQLLCMPTKDFSQSQSAYTTVNQANMTLYSCAYTANQYALIYCNNTECADIYALWVE